MHVFTGANRSKLRSVLLPLECYFLTVNCAVTNSLRYENIMNHADSWHRESGSPYLDPLQSVVKHGRNLPLKKSNPPPATAA